jgi:hypothetical protein
MLAFTVNINPEAVLDFTEEFIDWLSDQDLVAEAKTDDTGATIVEVEADDQTDPVYVAFREAVQAMASKYTAAPPVEIIDTVENPAGEAGKADDMGEEWRLKRQWRSKNTPSKVRFECKIKLTSDVTANFTSKVKSVASKQKNTTINITSVDNGFGKTIHTLEFISDLDNLKVAIDAVYNEVAKYAQ